jgi:hypothetical protein
MTTLALFIFAMQTRMFAVWLSSGRTNAPLLHEDACFLQRHRGYVDGRSAAVLEPCEISLDRMNDMMCRQYDMSVPTVHA